MPLTMKNEKFEITFDAEVPQILFQKKISIVFSTYQAGALVVIGSPEGRTLHQIPVSFKKPMGIAMQDNKLAVAGLEEVVFFSNAEDIVGSMKNNDKGFDTVFVQRAAFNVGMIDVHDIAFGDGQLWGINTKFSCIATFDINYSFRPKWKPNFIDYLMPEDKCHMNGMVMQDGLPKYVTALAKSNEKEGWRKDIMNTGILMEVPTSEIILEQLAMPHSPTWINNELYLLESGKGLLVRVDIEKKSKEVIFSFNRFVRGMTYFEGYLFIGTSKMRKSSDTFDKLDVTEQSNYAGFVIFDLKNRKIVGELNYQDTVDEIYDIAHFDGFMKPAIISQYQEQHNQVIVFPKHVFWKQPKEKEDQ